MKKKIINGLLFAVVLVAATSSFVSCKDYDGYNELQEKYLTLQDAFNKQVTAMQDYVLTSKYNQEVGANYDVNKGTIKQRLDDIEAELDPTNPNSLAEQVHKNNVAIGLLEGAVNSLGDTLTHFVFMWGDDLASAYKNAGKAKQIALSYDTDTAKINQAVKNAQDIADKAWNYVNQGLAKDKDGNTKEDFQAWVKYFEDADAALAEDIAALKQDVNNILTLVQQQVTGIEIQATYNPIFGTFSYPIDVQSNILAAYFGEFENPVKFPAGDKGAEKNTWVGNTPAVLSSELEAIGAPSETIGAGIQMKEGAGNAGKLYLTVNPSDVIMDGKEFTLRTSDNQVSKVVLSPLATCDEQLKWGYKRAASANGFYVATAEIKKDNVKDVALSFDLKNITDQVKDIMQDWSKVGASDLVKLLWAVSDGMKVDAPRLGVQAQWKDTLGWKNYVSKYDLAAFSVKPVGYDFLYDADFSPAIVKFQNKITAKEKALAQDLINAIADMIKIQINLPTTSGNVVVEGDKVYIVMPANSVSITGTATYTIHAGDFGTINLIDIPAADQTITADVDAKNPSQIKLDITSVFNAIKDGIEQSIAGIDGKAGNLINKYLEKIINVENKIFNKVAGVAKNPNRYVQPALVAKSEALGYFYPSRLYNAPTQIKKGTKISFYPTTLTGEVVAPAFKKYVAVTGAWSIDDMSEDRNASKFNNNGVLNTIFDGDLYNLQKPFEFTVDAPAGTVLEFTYECLGYNGKVAGKKFYIEVFE